MFKIRYDGSHCTFDSMEGALEEIKVFMREQDEPSMIALELVEMTQEEYDALPEFTGW